MLSKARIKQVRALEMKKYRDAQQLFVAEGNKLVADLMKVFECEWMAARPSWVEPLKLEAPKTKLLVGKLNGMGLKSTLIVVDNEDENLYLAARNLPHVLVLETRHIDPLSLVHYDNVLVTKQALAQIQEMLG